MKDPTWNKENIEHRTSTAEEMNGAIPQGEHKYPNTRSPSKSGATMYETYLQNEREIKEKYQYKFQHLLNTEDLPEDFIPHSEILSVLKIGYLNFVPSIYNDNRLSLIKVMKALEKELEGDKINWKYIKGNCLICDYMEHSGESHQCESFNQALQLSLDKIREFISKLEKEV